MIISLFTNIPINSISKRWRFISGKYIPKEEFLTTVSTTVV